MARQIIWTERAQKERIAIFSFWNNRNKSVIYSKKLYEVPQERGIFRQTKCVEPMALYWRCGRMWTAICRLCKQLEMYFGEL